MENQEYDFYFYACRDEKYAKEILSRCEVCDKDFAKNKGVKYILLEEGSYMGWHIQGISASFYSLQNAKIARDFANLGSDDSSGNFGEPLRFHYFLVAVKNGETKGKILDKTYGEYDTRGRKK